MILSQLIHNISDFKILGKDNQEVKGLCLHSGEAKEGFLYAAIKGFTSDGHDYISNAIENGAKTILCENTPSEKSSEVSYIKVEDSADALGKIASLYFGEPSKKLKVVAITGTNGKTTCVSLLFDLFKNLGYKCGLLSTVNIRIGDEIIPSTHTTPHSISIQENLALMVEKGCEFCFMEASSHAIVQKRMAGLELDVAGFTNLSHDHLDYHKTFAEYRDAKKLLFDLMPSTGACISNKDDKNGKYMLQNTMASRYFYGIKSPADFKAKILEMDMAGMHLEINNQEAWFQITGEFNASNLLLIYSIAFILGEQHEHIITTLSKVGKVPGRFEIIQSPKGKITGIVDYAHTPDALENILKSINKVRTKNESLITVFGCGGNRDQTKRPEMGRIAAKLSNHVILTSDNPRKENPEEIINQIEKGISPAHIKKTLSITDRRQAIQTAIKMAESSDIILIAGKGHEKYQDVNGEKKPFDDLDELRKGFTKYNK